MKSRAKVSVLVPIYNVEDFLSECLDSLVKQTLREIEIICINDGSTDSSLEIIKSYAKDDKRIVVKNLNLINSVLLVYKLQLLRFNPLQGVFSNS